MGDFAKDVNECLRVMQQGDRAAFDMLYVMTYNHMRYIVNRYLSNKSFLEDVISDTYAKVMNYAYAVDVSRDGYNWMCKIAQNMAISCNERERRIAKAERMYVADRKLLQTEEVFNEAEFFICMSKLSEFDSKLITMRFYLGMTFEEIGDRLGVSKVAVFQRIRKICQFIGKNFKF